MDPVKHNTCVSVKILKGDWSVLLCYGKNEVPVQKKQNVPPPNLLYLEYDTLKFLDGGKSSVFLV